MRSESEQYIGRLCEQPPLLEGIGRILVATENPRKVSSVDAMLQQFPVIRGQEILRAQPKGCRGDEPEWTNAVLVSRDKVDNVVHQIQGEFGPKTAVFSSDIVVWINREPYQNLSRVRKLRGKDLDRAVGDLQQKFSQEAEVMWDVATSVSRPELRVTLADRHIAHFAPIDPQRIHDAFWEDIPGALGRNSRVQLIEQFPDSIRDIGTVPFTRIVDRAGDFLGGHEWAEGIRPRTAERGRYLEEIQAQIVGGIPVNGRLKELLRVSPEVMTKGEWRLV